MGITPPKLYVTEWNRTVSERNYVNDSCFQGAYIIKNVIDVFDRVDILSYFNGSDLISEHYDSNELLHGGNGLLSKDGVLKPSGFAIDFLNHLYPYFIGKDSNYFITTDNRDNYSIVCHNMKNLSYYYYATSDEKIERDKLIKCFEDDFPLEINMELCDVPNGEYLIRIQRINNKNGSILHLWKDFNYYTDLSREDIKYFRRACEPKLTIHPYQAANSRISLKLSMMANEIALITIEKLL